MVAPLTLSGAWDCHTHIYGPWDSHPLPDNAAYQPPPAPFSVLQALHARLGITHGVLVQAACYGTDHSALLEAIANSAGAYRGVALITDASRTEDLQRLHEGGVRGVRFNLMGHLPGERDPYRLRQLAERIAPLGWHVLLHGKIPELLPVLEALEPVGVPLVIDHMARHDVTKESNSLDESGLQALEKQLRLPHCWIKLSGVDRVMQGLAPPWDAALSLARRLWRCAPDRVIWGSDWPHPNIQGAVPDEADLLAFLAEVCSDDAAVRAVLADNPRRLYGG